METRKSFDPRGPEDKPRRYHDLDDGDRLRSTPLQKAVALGVSIRECADRRGFLLPDAPEPLRSRLAASKPQLFDKDGRQGFNCQNWARTLADEILLQNIYPFACVRLAYGDCYVSPAGPEHVWVEVFDRKEWRLIDPTFARIATDVFGKLLSGEEVSHRVRSGTESTVYPLDRSKLYGDLTGTYPIPWDLCMLTVTPVDSHLRPPVASAPSPWPRWTQSVDVPRDNTLWPQKRKIGFRLEGGGSFACFIDGKPATVDCNMAEGLAYVRGVQRLSGLPDDVVTWTWRTR